MYEDEEGEDKTSREVSYRGVRSRAGDQNQTGIPRPGPNYTGQCGGKDQEREVAENARAGTNLGAPVAANDPGDVLTYSLGGADATSFDIVRSSGQLRIKAALDFEMTGGPRRPNNEYAVTVMATDPFGANGFGGT